MIRIGCAGFPVGKKKYEAQLSIVEVSPTYPSTRFPSDKILTKWRTNAPANFEFVVSFSLVADSSKLKNSALFQQAQHVAHLLKSKIVHVNLPFKWAPKPDHIQSIQNLFRAREHKNLFYVWNPPLSWPNGLVKDLSSSLQIVPSSNPLKEPRPFSSIINYLRIGKTRTEHGLESLHSNELERIRKACTQSLAYVIFDNGPTSFNDAVQFSLMTASHTASRTSYTHV